MELLQLLLYTTAFTQLSYSSFFYFCFTSLFLHIVSHSKLTPIKHEFDISSLIVNLTCIMLHLMLYNINYLISIIKKNKYGIIVINNYNYLNKQYLNCRKQILYYVILVPLKYVFKKMFLPDVNESDIYKFKQFIIDQNYNKKTIKELKTDEDIADFLNKFSLTD